MQASKGEKARLGVFLLLAGAVLAATVFYMVGRKLLTQTIPYSASFEESVTGLEKGSPLKQNGVDIGSVSDILTDSSDIRKTIVRLAVNKGVPMKSDMMATLGSYGITGLKYVEITGGSYSSSNLPAGGELHTSMSTLARISSRADSIAYKIDKLLGNVIEITEGNSRSHINNLIAKSAALASSLDTLVQDVNRIRPGKRVDAIMAGVEASITDLRGQIKRAKLDSTVQEYRNAALAMQATTGKVDVTVRRAQEDVAVSLQQLKETMKNMNTFSRQIKENPSILLRGQDKKERQP